MPDMQKKYKEEIRPALQAKLGLKNVMQIPGLKKIVISTGIPSGSDRDTFSEAQKQIGLITGQHPVITKARKNVANFKLRVGDNSGVMVTLRGKRMYDFIEKLINISFPRVRDFRGIPGKSFDGRGNYNMGVKEQIIFPEIEYEKIDAIRGMNITITTSAKTDDEAKALLLAFKLPLKK